MDWRKIEARKKFVRLRVNQIEKMKLTIRPPFGLVVSRMRPLRAQSCAFGHSSLLLHCPFSSSVHCGLLGKLLQLLPGWLRSWTRGHEDGIGRQSWTLLAFVRETKAGIDHCLGHFTEIRYPRLSRRDDRARRWSIAEVIRLTFEKVERGSARG